MEVAQTVQGSIRHDLRRSALELYAVKIEAVACDVESMLTESGPASGMREHRRELDLLGDLLDQLGWEESEDCEAIELRADLAILREICWDALATAVGGLAELATESKRADRLARWIGLLARAVDLTEMLLRLGSDDAVSASV